jgi:8-oxo-dGTP diphosphatase
MKEENPEEVATAVLYNPQKKKFLLLKRSEDRERYPRRWEFPSGFIEAGEIPEDAALRELKEETTLTGEVVRIGESFPIQIPKVEIHPVLVKVNEDKVELSREHTDYRWVDKSELNVLDTVPKLKQDLDKLGVE